MAWGIGLHEKQVRAAEFLGTHARLLAGPGTGKTVTLISRIIKLITEDGIAPESIVTLVFTRVNAFDLRRTLTSELDEFGKGIPLSARYTHMHYVNYSAIQYL